MVHPGKPQKASQKVTEYLNTISNVLCEFNISILFFENYFFSPIKLIYFTDYLLFEPKEQFVDPDEEDEEMFASQSYEAQARIQQLDEKIQTKRQALEALRASKLVTCDDVKDIKVHCSFT